MKLNTCSFLADENIHAELIGYLIEEGFNVLSVNDLNLNGMSDEVIVDAAIIQQRVILTQDSDFGTILFTTKKEFVGIIFLRPGHFAPGFHIKTLETVL